MNWKAKDPEEDNTLCKVRSAGIADKIGFFHNCAEPLMLIV